MEIERKFFLKRLPDGLDLGTGMRIEQGYVLSDAVELRLRRQENQFFITVKTSGTVARNEWVSAIPEWVYLALWPKTGRRHVSKTRHTITEAGFKLELDIYHGDLTGLIILECEFTSLEDARLFTLPGAFANAVEVTDDLRYKNKCLAERGKPQKDSNSILENRQSNSKTRDGKYPSR